MRLESFLRTVRNNAQSSFNVFYVSRYKVLKSLAVEISVSSCAYTLSFAVDTSVVVRMGDRL